MVKCHQYPSLLPLPLKKLNAPLVKLLINYNDLLECHVPFVITNNIFPQTHHIRILLRLGLENSLVCRCRLTISVCSVCHHNGKCFASNWLDTNRTQNIDYLSHRTNNLNANSTNKNVTIANTLINKQFRCTIARSIINIINYGPEIPYENSIFANYTNIF